MRQTTIKRSIECSGLGMQKKGTVRFRLLPAPEDAGILLRPGIDMALPFEALRPELLARQGAFPGAGPLGPVGGLEHLLAAIRGLEIDNVRIEAEGGEIPVMDGSAASFVFLLRSAGIVRQNADRRYLFLKKPFHFERNGTSITAEPGDELRLDLRLQSDHPLIGTQNLRYAASPERFMQSVARARAWAFLKDLDAPRPEADARIGCCDSFLDDVLDKAMVLDNFGAINAEDARFQDEAARHAGLDFLGALACLRLPVLGLFTVRSSGPSVDEGFLRTLLDNADIFLKEGLAAESSPSATPARGLIPSPTTAPATAAF